MNFYDFWVVFVGAFYFSSSISGLYFVDCLPLFSLTTLHIRAVTYRTEEQRGVKAGHQPPPLFNPSPLTSRKGLNFYSTLGYLLFPLVSGIFFSPWAAEKNSGEKKNFGALRKRCFFFWWLSLFIGFPSVFFFFASGFSFVIRMWNRFLFPWPSQDWRGTSNKDIRGKLRQRRRIFFLSVKRSASSMTYSLLMVPPSASR